MTKSFRSPLWELYQVVVAVVVGGMRGVEKLQLWVEKEMEGVEPFHFILPIRNFYVHASTPLPVSAPKPFNTVSCL